VIRALEQQRPIWEPGTQHLYHGWTVGFLVGEVVRRITGKSLGRFFAEQVAAPLQLSAWIGLPEAIEPKVAHLVETPPPATLPEPAAMLAGLDLDEETRREAAETLRAIRTDPVTAAPLGTRSGGAFPQLVTEDGFFNARVVRAAEFPSANMVTDARSLARMYAATVADVDGVRLLEPETVERMAAVQTANSVPYGWPARLAAVGNALGIPFSLGFMLSARSMPLLGPRSFGHPGAGGSLGFADRDTGIGFGYVMNLMATDVDPRAASLVAAVSECVAPSGSSSLLGNSS
jgi:CubicO group peptidase (beta-lactamase class C family)